MMWRESNENYESGFAIGWSDGQRQGFIDGYDACRIDYEIRVAQLSAELISLNARIDYLEKVTGE